MTRPLFLFVHGWAGTPRLWDRVCAALTARGVADADMRRIGPGEVFLPEQLFAPPFRHPGEGRDPGSQAQPFDMDFSGAEPSRGALGPWVPASAGMTGRGDPKPTIIGVGHSLGAAWLLQMGVRLSGFVAINGFTRFSATADFPAGTPPRVLALMRRRLLADPGPVLADFHTRAGLPLPETPGDVHALAAGLDLLGSIDVRGPFGDFASPHVALCGADDVIVPPAHSAACFDQPLMVAGAGHALPVSHPDLSADHIMSIARRCREDASAPLASGAMLTGPDKRAVAGRFAAAAGRYDAAARVQARIAGSMADRLAGLDLRPGARVLEIGCGTGLLTAAALSRLPGVGSWLATDIAPAMAASCHHRLSGDPRLSVAVMDGEAAAVAGPFDLICSSLALQWFPDAGAALASWRGMLAPGGMLLVATLGVDTFAEWRTALAQAGAGGAGPAYPDAASLARWLGPGGQVERQDFVEQHADARHFLHALRGIGADYAPARVAPTALRRAMRLLDQTRPVTVTYDVRWLSVGGNVARPVDLA